MAELKGYISVIVLTVVPLALGDVKHGAQDGKVDSRAASPSVPRQLLGGQQRELRGGGGHRLGPPSQQVRSSGEAEQ